MESYQVFSEYILMPTTLPRVQIYQKRLGLRVLGHVLVKMYGEEDIGKLVKRSEIIDEAFLFTKYVLDALSMKTSQNKYQILHILRKILRETTVPEVFIDRLGTNVQRQKSEHEDIIPSYILKKNIIPVETLVDWISQFRRHSNLASVKSLRIAFTLICRFVVKYDWNNGRFLNTFTNEDVAEFCSNHKARLNWLRIFIIKVLALDDIPLSIFDPIVNVQKSSSNPPENDDGTDIHRISTVDIELMYDEAKKDTFKELVFLLLLTTGLRVGGLVSIRLDKVADIKHNQVFVKRTGMALEKGGSWFTFQINPRVSGLIEEYIKTKRPSVESEYLFCTKKSKQISPSMIYNVIKALSKSSGLEGREFHPHAFRHTYAHILLECGNSVETVSKLLNHKSVNTTMNYYLKENSAELAARSNIPWLQKNKEPTNPVPKFLQPKNTPRKKNERRKQVLAGLENLGKHIPSSPST